MKKKKNKEAKKTKQKTTKKKETLSLYTFLWGFFCGSLKSILTILTITASALCFFKTNFHDNCNDE